VFFEICGDLTEIETFAVGSGIRELARLGKLYGKGRWRQRKASGTLNCRMAAYGERSFTGTKLPESAKGIQDQALRGLAVPSRRYKTQGFAVCLQNTGYPASLEIRKLYAVLDDADADANNLIRVIDESGEGYVYPARLFQKLTLPAQLQRALRAAS
jgi:hypothetical protein